jgi:hypothetical protein
MLVDFDRSFSTESASFLTAKRTAHFGVFFEHAPMRTELN